MIEAPTLSKPELTSKLNLTAQTCQVDQVIHQFEKNLSQTPLSAAQLKLFMGTLWAFYKETPSGILALSLRVADEWMKVDQWNATAMAAYLFHADIHEFGLEEMKVGEKLTHHQLFLKTCEYFNITRDDLLNPTNQLKGGETIGKLSFEYYRNHSLGEALGFHLGSEMTSDMEFNAFLNGFLANKSHYGVESKHDEAMKLFFIHSIVEPEHSENSRTIIDLYLQQFPDQSELIQKGFEAYMTSYYQLFDDLNSNLF